MVWLHQARPGGRPSPAPRKQLFSFCTDDGTDDPEPQGREQWGPGSQPWLLDLRSGFSQSKNMNGPPKTTSCKPDPGPSPLGHSYLPTRHSPSFIPSRGRRLSCRERVGPGTTFVCLFLHIQATLKSHPDSVLHYREQRHALQLCPLEGPALTNQSPAML